MPDRFDQAVSRRDSSSNNQLTPTCDKLTVAAQPAQTPRVCAAARVPFANGDRSANDASPIVYPIRRPSGLHREQVLEPKGATPRR